MIYGTSQIELATWFYKFITGFLLCAITLMVNNSRVHKKVLDNAKTEWKDRALKSIDENKILKADVKNKNNTITELTAFKNVVDTLYIENRGE